MSVSASARQSQKDKRITASQARSTTLTQITFLARNFLTIALIVFIVLLLGKLSYDGVLLYIASQRARQPERINRQFGALPEIAFPTQSSSEKPTAYTLKLTDSKGKTLEAFPEPILMETVVRVYPTQSIGDGPGLEIERKARKVATAFGFDGEPQTVGQVYRWTNDIGSLEVDTDSFATMYNSNYLSNNELLNQPGKTLPTNAEAVAIFKQVLTEAGLLTEDVATMSATITHVKASGNSLAVANSVGEADFIQIALHRAPVYHTFYNQVTGEPLRTVEYPIVEPNTQVSSIVGIVARDWLDNDQVAQLRYVYQPVNYLDYGVYNARTPQQAWQDVVATGEAYVEAKGKSETAIVDKVELAYYEAATAQEYLQPVYVFSGRDGFVGYASAVEPSQVAL